MKMSLLSGTLVVTLCIVFTNASSLLEKDESELLLDDSELLERTPRDVKYNFPHNRLPRPTPLCFRQPCKLPSTFLKPLLIRQPRSLTPYEDEVSVMEDELESLDRRPRDVKFTFPGQNRIPPPPTALCFRQPCNVPGGFRGPTQQRHRRSVAIQPNEDEVTVMEDEIESLDRRPRDVKFTFPGQNRIPPPPTALCFRQPCNVPGGFRGPTQQRHRRSIAIESDEESRIRRSAKFDDKGFRDFTPETNTRGMLYGTKSFGPNSHGGWVGTGKIEHDFWKSNDGNQRLSGYIKHDRVLGGRFDGFKDTNAGIGYSHRFRRSPYPEESNTRGMIYSTKSFGPNSHGGWQSTAKVEHDIWKSKDGNQQLSGYIRHDRIDGGRFDGSKDTKAGIGFSHKF